MDKDVDKPLVDAINRSRDSEKAHVHVHLNDIKKDVDISKRIVQQMVTKNVQAQKVASLLHDAIEREMQWRNLQFVSVEIDPKESAEKVLYVKSLHPKAEVQPYSLDRMFDDVDISAHEVPSLPTIASTFTVSNPTKEMPNRITFYGTKCQRSRVARYP